MRLPSFTARPPLTSGTPTEAPISPAANVALPAAFLRKLLEA